MSPIFLTKKDEKRVIVKENVLPGVGAINKDSGHSLIFNNLIRRVTGKFSLLENYYFTM